MPTDKQIRAELRELQKEGIELLKELTKGLLVAQERKKDPEKNPSMNLASIASVLSISGGIRRRCP